MDRPLLYSRRQNDAKNFIAILFFFLLMTGIILAFVLPLTLNRSSPSCPPTPTPAPVEQCPSFSVSNYSFNFSPCSNCGVCITFLNNSLYFLSGNNTQSFIYPFSIINDTAVYGPNQINSQNFGGNVYGCGRQNDTNIYISTDTYRLAAVSTIEQNLRDLNGQPVFYTRGFAIQNSNIYKVTAFNNPSLYLNNTKIANLRLGNSTCNIPIYGHGIAVYNGQFYIAYAGIGGVNSRKIGILSLNGTVYPTCSNITRSFNALTFDNDGQLWALVGNGGPDARKVFKFWTPPPILIGDAPCGTFGTLKGSEMIGLTSGFGFPVQISGNGQFVIAASTSGFSNVIIYKFIQNEWFRLGETFFTAVSSVSISYDGSIIAIGDESSQVLRVYRLVSCSTGSCAWQQIGSNINSAGFAVSLSPDGLTVASSSPFSGQTYVHDWNEPNNVWILRGSSINGTMVGDYSGWSISLYGKNRIAIGATEILTTGIGKTKIYEWNGTFWAQMGQDIIGENVDDNSGNSVSLQNNTVAIGAWENDGNGTQSGETKIYEWNGTYWNQKGQDIQGEFAFDYSATTVSLSEDGNTVAIGAIYNPIITENGHVRIYDYISGVWVQRGFDIDGTTGSRAGYCSLSNDGKTVAVGAPNTSGGLVRVYCI